MFNFLAGLSGAGVAHALALPMPPCILQKFNPLELHL